MDKWLAMSYLNVPFRGGTNAGSGVSFTGISAADIPSEWRVLVNNGRGRMPGPDIEVYSLKFSDREIWYEYAKTVKEGR